MMNPTNTIVGTRKSFIGSVVWFRVDFEQIVGLCGVWCGAGLILSKTWVENQ
jgi:hypothetical protein